MGYKPYKTFCNRNKNFSKGANIAIGQSENKMLQLGKYKINNHQSQKIKLHTRSARNVSVVSPIVVDITVSLFTPTIKTPK